MFKTFLLSTLFIFTILCVNATVYYVNSTQPNNSGNGLSWGNAKKDVQNAINLAIVGDSVWVATGTYLPTDYPPTSTTPLTNRHKTIYITDGVKIYGGFVGTETNFNQRNIGLNTTTLSGDFSNNDVATGSGSSLVITGNSENAYHVVLSVVPSSGGTGVVVDGFAIKGGNANTSTANIMFGSVTIYSGDGGAIYCYGGNNILRNDSLYYNASTNTAGLNLLNSSNLIENCNVVNNSGYGILCNSSNIIYSNVSYSRLCGIVGNRNNISYNTITHNGSLGGSTGGIRGDSCKITYNTISFNYGTYGGGISSNSNDTIMFNTINYNQTKDLNFSNVPSGAGIYCNLNANFIFNNTIQGNKAVNGNGGGIYIGEGVVSNNIIKQDTTMLGDGGGIYAGTAVINNNAIIQNYSIDQGGGINANSATILNNSIISNSAYMGGGIFYNSGKLANNVIALNVDTLFTASSISAGGVVKTGMGDSIINNTFYKNIGKMTGGFWGLSHMSINNIFWRNGISSGASVFYDDFETGYSVGSPNLLTFMNCVVQYPISNYTFTGASYHDLGILASNIMYATDPQFMDTLNIAGIDGIYGTADDGLRLKSTSPCINAGFSGASIPLVDIIGTSRPQGTGIDIGAYEKIYCPPVTVPTNISSTASLNICNGLSTTLSVNSSEPAGNVFWYTDSLVTLSIDTGYTFTTGILNATDTFWVSAHNCDSASALIPIIVHVISPVITIASLPNDTICTGNAITLTASGANTYSWSGGIINGVPFNPTLSNTYTVLATDINNCTNSATQSITVKPIITPTISITPSITQGATGDPITYTATTNVPSPYSIDWYRNLSLSNTSIINTWNTTIVTGTNDIYAVIKSPTNCLSPDSAKSSALTILNVTGVSTFFPQGFSIYPNPTSNQLIIEGLLKNDKISLYNYLGQLIFSELNSDSKLKVIPVSNYSTGIYIIQFERNKMNWRVQFEKK